MGDGTCWRDAVQTAEMWWVTLQVKRQQGQSRQKPHSDVREEEEEKVEGQKNKNGEVGGIWTRRLAVNHVLTGTHAIAFSHAASHTLWLDRSQERVETLF